MSLETKVFAYEGVPIELAEAAAAELERAMDFADLRAHVKPLSAEQGKALGVDYREWTPPVVKNLLRLNLTEDGGRKELRERLRKVNFKTADDALDKLLGIVKVSPDTEKKIKERLETEKKEAQSILDKINRRFPGEYFGPPTKLEEAIEIYGLSKEQINELETSLVFNPENNVFVPTKLTKYFREIADAGIKIITTPRFDNSNLDGKTSQKHKCILYPFIQIHTDTLPHHYVLARGLINVASNPDSPCIGEAVYFWNKGEKQTAVDFASYCLIHEFGGHSIGGLTPLDDLSEKKEYIPNEKGEERFDVMRAPLNAQTLQKEIQKYGRDTRLRFRTEDIPKIAENVKANYVA